jgi:Arc/MetJ-type ribon-helix-helix transcriptional regulator
MIRCGETSAKGSQSTITIRSLANTREIDGVCHCDRLTLGVPIMLGDLSPSTESFIQQEIALGEFQSREDALEAGVSLLRKRRELLDKLDEGQRQLDAGQYVEFDEEGLRLFFEGLKDRARTRQAKA